MDLTRPLIGWFLVTWYRLKSNVARAGNTSYFLKVEQNNVSTYGGFIVTNGWCDVFADPRHWLGKRGKNPLVLSIEDVLKMEPPVKKRFSNLSVEEICRMVVEKVSK